jgi:osmotically-inducible protein OsmY
MDCKHGFNVKTALVVMMSVFLPIAIARAESHPDAWITMKARAALEVAAGVRASAVKVDTRDGRVTLSGKVRSEKEKASAAEKVGNVEGVVQVRNLLQVVAPGNRERVRRSDDAVKTDVQRTLRADRSLNAVAAPSVARNVGIPMEIVPSVQRYPVDTEDDVIRRGVEKALHDLDARENADIHVLVKDGIVWLTGSVPTWQGNDSRVYAARSVTGVRSIINSLRVVALNVSAR